MTAKRPICTNIFQMSHGGSMPAVGLGTWQGRPGAEDELAMVNSLIHALHSGYRLLDTAQAYGVEHIVGQAVRNSGVPREEITIVTKFWANWHHDPSQALDNSLQAMQLDYVDVFLMHWPGAVTAEGKYLGVDESPTFVETWKKMEGLVGPRCRAIGVSNFSEKTLETLLENTAVVPAVNQIEVHAFNPCLKLVPYCESKGIHVMAWGSLGRGDEFPMSQILTHETFEKIAKAKGCSVGVVHLSWAVQRGMTVIPRTKSNARLEENIRLVTLSDEEMATMNSAQDTVGKYRSADTALVEKDGKKTIFGWTKQDCGWEDENGTWLT